MNQSTKFNILISGKEVEIEVSVNDHGNLVLGGVGGVNYQMYDEELVLMRNKPKRTEVNNEYIDLSYEKGGSNYTPMFD